MTESEVKALTEQVTKSIVTDKTLTLDNAPADAKAVGEAIGAINIPELDSSLSITGAAADAKAVGDRLLELNVPRVDDTLSIIGAAADAEEVGRRLEEIKIPVVDASLTQEGAAADAAAVGTTLETKQNLINIGNYDGDLNSLDIPLNSIAWVNGANCANSPTSAFAWLETWGSHNDSRIQRITTTSGTNSQRIYINGAWADWEWNNPYLTNGLEELTTERWNGHKIYKRNIACGALTEGRKLVELPELAKCVVLDAFGYVNQGSNNFTMIPSIYSKDLSATTSVSLLVNTTNTNGAIQIWGGSGLVGKTAFVQLKYFKL